MIWYPYGSSTEFPPVGTNANDRAAMVGSFYRFNPALDSAVKLPADYDNHLFIFDYTRDWIQTIELDANGNYVGMERFLASVPFVQPIDAEIGPDGALYVLEWGNGHGHESGPEAKLSRVEFKGTANGAPTAVANATPRRWRRAADGQFLQRRVIGSRGRRADLRLGLHRRRHHRFDRGQPQLHLPRHRRLHRQADRHRSAGQDRRGVAEHHRWATSRRWSP